MAFKRQRMGRRKVCYFTKNKITYIDYKDVELLKQNGAKVITLGKRILRTETVALNVLSIIMYELEN